MNALIWSQLGENQALFRYKEHCNIQAIHA